MTSNNTWRVELDKVVEYEGRGGWKATGRYRLVNGRRTDGSWPILSKDGKEVGLWISPEETEARLLKELFGTGSAGPRLYVTS